jgi:DnaJ-class molecular chaperone
VAPIPDENAKLVKSLLGVPEPRASKLAPGVQRCTQCEGNGWCLTDSLVPNYTETQCSACAGKGWTGAQPVTGVNGEQVQPSTVTGPTVYQPVATEDDPVVAGLKAKGYLVVAPANVGG